MKRVCQIPREGWQDIVSKQGLIWHTTPGQTGDGESNILANPTTKASPYWDESACYEFSLSQIEQMEKATVACYEMLLELGEWVLTKDKLPAFLQKMLGTDKIDVLSLWGIPEKVHGLIRETWDKEPPCLNYGRFDFAWNGTGEPKLLEFNCDTPTSLIEASLIQWYWKEEVRPECDQYNSIHEKLLAKFQDIRTHLPLNFLHFTSFQDEPGEDQVTVAYLRDCAEQVGISTHQMSIHDIGWNPIVNAFADDQDRLINSIFKLYPWEWMVHESFADNLVTNSTKTNWMEPIWKMLWSNKFILPMLWEMFPESPYLLQASNKPMLGMDFVKKPILSREGANIEIHRSGSEIETQIIAKSGGEYGHEGYIYQELYKLPGENGQHPVLGAWIVDGEPAGMGIREAGLITDNTARFIPHVILP